MAVRPRRKRALRTLASHAAVQKATSPLKASHLWTEAALQSTRRLLKEDCLQLLQIHEKLPTRNNAVEFY